MNSNSRKSLIRLGAIVGGVLLALLIGKLSGPESYDWVVSLLKGAGLVILGLTVLVTIHELGHFLAAKAFGMRVEAFSIGFPPKLFSVQRGDTEYQIGATPLGGYVKITGIIDESMDADTIRKEKLKTDYEQLIKKGIDPDSPNLDPETKKIFEQKSEWEPKPWEFRSKPIWQRLIVMVGGVVMNVILGVAIFSIISYSRGEYRTPVNELKYGIEVLPSIKEADKCGNIIDKTTLGYFLGFRTGDKLLSFKGTAYSYVEDYRNPNLLLESEPYYEVERAGKIERINIPDNVLNKFNNDSIIVELFSFNTPAQIKLIEPDTSKKALNKNVWPAHKAGLQNGDLIVALDSFPVRYYADVLTYLPKQANKEVAISIQRGDSLIKRYAQLDSTAKLGIYRDPVLYDQLKQDTTRYNPAQAIAAGAKRAFNLVSLNARGLGKIAGGQVNAGSSVMGPLAIAKQYLNFFTEGGWPAFWVLTGSLSMVLAFVNILPIPALDGGHVIFLLIEGLMGREPSPKIRIIAQQIGMVLILGLMVLVLFNDFFQNFWNSCPK